MPMSRMTSGGTTGASLWIVKGTPRSRVDFVGLIPAARSSPRASSSQLASLRVNYHLSFLFSFFGSSQEFVG